MCKHGAVPVSKAEDLTGHDKKTARRIDAAIRKAANAAAWDVKLNQPNESSYAWTEAKYGPRPAKKARKK